MRTHFILFILLFVISCKNIKDETLTNVLTNMEINIPKKEINNLGFITNAEYVQLDNNHLIGEIGRLFLDKKKIIVFDKIDNAIVLFDHKGKFLKSIKKKGRGPGEYIRITDIALDRKNNSIIIFDEMSHKLVYYDLDSYKFLKETGIGFYPTSFVVSGAKLFFYNPFTLNYSGNKEFYFSLIETNEDLEIVNTYFPVNKKLGMFMASDNGPGLTYGSNIIYFRNRFDFNVYSLDDGDLSLSLKLTFEDNDEYENVIKKAVLNNDFHYILDSGVPFILDIIDSEKYIVFKYFRSSEIYYVVIRKTDGKIILNSSNKPSFNDELIKNGVDFFMFPQYSGNNRFISILSAENIAQLHSNQSLEQLDKSYRNSKFYKRFKNISVNENPIIAFYEFN